jgi:cell division protein FtsL
MNNTMMLVAFLAALNFCTAVGVVYVKYLSRQSYTEVSRSQQEIDRLQVQWSQLQIEEGTFSEHGRVERTARDRLGMALPAFEETVMIIR